MWQVRRWRRLRYRYVSTVWLHLRVASVRSSVCLSVCPIRYVVVSTTGGASSLELGMRKVSLLISCTSNYQMYTDHNWAENLLLAVHILQISACHAHIYPLSAICDVLRGIYWRCKCTSGILREFGRKTLSKSAYLVSKVFATCRRHGAAFVVGQLQNPPLPPLPPSAVAPTLWQLSSMYSYHNADKVFDSNGINLATLFHIARRIFNQPHDGQLGQTDRRMEERTVLSAVLLPSVAYWMKVPQTNQLQIHG